MFLSSTSCVLFDLHVIVSLFSKLRLFVLIFLYFCLVLGDIVLQNLVLKQSALDELDLPVRTVYGVLGMLSLWSYILYSCSL